MPVEPLLGPLSTQRSSVDPPLFTFSCATVLDHQCCAIFTYFEQFGLLQHILNNCKQYSRVIRLQMGCFPSQSYKHKNPFWLCNGHLSPQIAQFTFSWSFGRTATCNWPLLSRPMFTSVFSIASETTWRTIGATQWWQYALITSKARQGLKQKRISQECFVMQGRILIETSSSF